MMESSKSVTKVRVEPATLGDLPELVTLLYSLFEAEEDFSPDKQRQEEGLRLILEQPNRGRIFVVRTDHTIIGMANVLIVISTAVGGFVLLLEDLIIHPAHRGQGYGGLLMEKILEFAKNKDFKRITLLTDKVSAESQRFFESHGFEFSHMIPIRLYLDGE